MYKHTIALLFLLFCGCSVYYGKVSYGAYCSYGGVCSEITKFDKFVASCSRYDKTCLVNSETRLKISNTEKELVRFVATCHFYIGGIRMEDVNSKKIFLGPNKNVTLRFYYVFAVPLGYSSSVGVRCSVEQIL